MRRKKSLPEAPKETNLPEASLKQTEMGEKHKTRRHFLIRLGLGATLLALFGQAYAYMRSLVPNLLYEEPRRFKVGSPDQFSEGPTYLEAQRVYIFRQKNTLHAISAICTHLGCTVKMKRLDQPQKVKIGERELENKLEFHCPCHGSKYYEDGSNFAGPAPKPLSCYKLEFSPDDGQIIVDMSQVVNRDFRLTV
jgi:menaquinol-cytochrome c reductase iron-sulfur subunit